MKISNKKIYLNQKQELKDLNMIKNNMKLKLAEIKLSDNNLLDNERRLIQFNKRIRKKWIKNVGISNSFVYKSTLWGTDVKDLQGYKYHFSYETLLNDENSFADLMGYSIKEMNNKTFLFSSGMSAITSILYCLSSFIKGSLDIQVSAGYFETKYFFKLLNSMGNKVVFDLESSTSTNVFYFEPIKYDATLSVTDPKKLIDSINASNANLKIIIMDSTMSNQTRIFNILKDKIKNIENTIFIDIRSGLKLDEEGLELSNLGIATVFVSKSNENLFKIFKNYIEQYKGLTGTNISFYSLCLSHYFQELNAKEYVCKVKKQIIWAVKNLNIKNSKKIKKIIWKKVNYYGDTLISPFIFLELYNNNEKNYLDTINTLQNLMKNKGLNLDYRNSWGFRMPSIEYFNDIFTQKKYIKYYPGSFKGLTAVEAINSINRL